MPFRKAPLERVVRVVRKQAESQTHFLPLIVWPIDVGPLLEDRVAPCAELVDRAVHQEEHGGAAVAIGVLAVGAPELEEVAGLVVCRKLVRAAHLPWMYERTTCPSI